LYLLILESIGTQELILIGIIALVVFGPRKLPEMAKKLGSMMTEFRRVSSDFRSTWENAVSLDESKKSERINEDAEFRDPFEADGNINKVEKSQKESKKLNGKTVLPEVREVSSEEFKDLTSDKNKIKKPAQLEKTEWI
jgi:Tat protein translocase TatB subunit